MIVRQYLLWSKTAPDAARGPAAEAIARAYLYGAMDAADRADFETSFPAIIEAAGEAEHLAFARVLCRHPGVPFGMVKTLVALGGEVELILLTCSPVLTERDLIEYCESGDALRQMAIAGREGLTAPVAAALAEIADADVCRWLVSNRRADVPGFALGRIVARHGHVPALREVLLSRIDLPAGAHQALIRVVASTLSAFVVERAWLDEDGAARLEEEACERAAIAMADAHAGREARALAEHLLRQGELTPALALRALLSGKMRLFLEVVSVLSGLPTDRVAALAADRSGHAFRTLYDRIGLPRGAFIAFRTALQMVQQESYLDEKDGAAGLKRRIVEAVIARYATLGEAEGSPTLLALLRRWQDEAMADERGAATLAA